MCEFISWIEKDKKCLFLTTKDIESFYGKTVLQGSKDNDFIGHGAISEFFKNPGGYNRENRNFWNGNLPQEIKDAWNQGELDGMLGYLMRDDVEYIITNAPPEFISWVLKNKYQDFEAMKKDPDWYIRLVGLAVTKDFETMKKDPDRYIRLAGLAVTKDFEAMKKDSVWYIRLVGLAVTKDFETMKKDSDSDIRLVGLAATLDFKNITRPVL